MCCVKTSLYLRFPLYIYVVRTVIIIKALCVTLSQTISFFFLAIHRMERKSLYPIGFECLFSRSKNVPVKKYCRNILHTHSMQRRLKQRFVTSLQHFWFAMFDCCRLYSHTVSCNIHVLYAVQLCTSIMVLHNLCSTG